MHLCSGDEAQSGVTMVIVVVRDKLLYPTPCGDKIREAPIGVPGPILCCAKEGFDMGVVV